jgi:transposase-like protein
MHRGRVSHPEVNRSAFAGFRFPPEVITVAVRWYLRYGLSYRDVEELLAERGIEVDHVTVYRWVQRFTPLFADAGRPLRHATGDRWFVDETYVKVGGRWRYLYRAVDQYGQVIDVLLSEQRDTAAARRFFIRAMTRGQAPVEVTTDKAGPHLRVLDELLPAAAHVTEQYANNRIEADHARLKARLRPVRGLKRFRSAAVIAARTCLRAEPPPRPLRTGHRRPTAAPAGNGIQRTRAGHMTGASPRPDACHVRHDATDPGRAARSRRIRPASSTGAGRRHAGSADATEPHGGGSSATMNPGIFSREVLRRPVRFRPLQPRL